MIETQHLCKSFGKIEAVRDLELHVAQGENFGLLGPNGAGKTTTIRMLMMLTRPTSGVAYINGYDVTRDLDQVKKEIGVVPQHMNLDEELSARENLELHCRLHHVPSVQRKNRIRELLEYVDLEDRADDMVAGFSGGMKRRLMVARALLHNPRVLFLDEPTVGLDPQTRRKIWDLIQELNRNRITILLTTHYIEEAEMLCQRVGIMDNGALIALGSPGELTHQVGEFVLEIRGNQEEYRFFNSRQKAIQYADQVDDDVIIRESNLEDVFIGLTGRKVRDEG